MLFERFIARLTKPILSLAAAAAVAFSVVPETKAADAYAWYPDGAEVVYWTRYAPRFITTNVPSTIAANTTATNQIILDVRNVDTIAAFISASLTLTNPAAHALILPYVTSLDGTNYTTAAVGSIAVSLLGTATQSAITNINCENYGFIKITGFQNTGTNGVVATNSIKLQVVSKPKSDYSRSR